MIFRLPIYIFLSLVFVISCIAPEVRAQDAFGDSIVSDDKVDLLANEIIYDEMQELVTAIGAVELTQSGRILRANKISYDLTQDKVQAQGDIVLNELTGDVYFADKIELKDQMKNGFVTGLKSVLSDGSRFTAEQAEKISDLKIILEKASYTACEPCKKDPDKAPIWQIKSDKVTHHKDEARISYEDASFEVAGVPIAYTPYFSHPDGSVDRKSGLLTPSVGFDSGVGAFYAQEYYYNISPSQDATIGATVMTDANPLLTGEYRKRYKDAEINVNAGITYNERQDIINDQEVTQEDDFRGHLFADGLWNINEKWRAGTQLEYVSDDQYLRRYNFSNDDILESKIYAERFDKRNYALGRMIRFKDIRVSDRAEDQPNILPEIYSSFIGAPNSALGGRLDIEVSALNLGRAGDEQDVLRGTSKVGWEKRHISNIGLISDLDINLRGDAYRANDREIATDENSLSSDATAIRGFANAQYKASMPFEKITKNAQVIIEPIAAINAGTNINKNDDIPNEDSEDTFLDTTNIFNSNRFPGYDRIEDRSHATYGVRTGLHNFNGNKAEVFVGQSYRFEKDEDENPFPKGSGLSERQSDLVGSLSIDVANTLNLYYATRLDNDNLASKRHELSGNAKIKNLDLNMRYFYANALEGTDLDDEREQIQTFGRYHFNDQWSAYSGIQYDLAEQTEGLRRFRYGVDYKGQCINVGIGGERKLTRDFSGDSGTTILVRLGLKNLGDFESSGFSVGGEE